MEDRPRVAPEEMRLEQPAPRVRALVKKVCEHDADHGHFPDYAVAMDDDVILFRNRSGLKSKPDPVAVADDAPYIDPETMHDAKTAAPGYDVYALYDEWVSWWHDMDKPELKSPAGVPRLLQESIELKPCADAPSGHVHMQTCEHDRPTGLSPILRSQSLNASAIASCRLMPCLRAVMCMANDISGLK
jgi:hypothetical protein